MSFRQIQSLLQLKIKKYIYIFINIPRIPELYLVHDERQKVDVNQIFQFFETVVHVNVPLAIEKKTRNITCTRIK